MDALRYKDEHNKVGYLLKPTRSDDYHQIIDFLRASHVRSLELGPPAILATIDKTPYTITEDLVRSRLQLADDGVLLIYPFTKSGSWDQFGSPLAVALICLSDGRRFNWSSYIFNGMVSNIKNAKQFLMYPGFLQTILGLETRITRQYKVLIFSSKLFANMRLNFAGHPMPLLPAMLLQAQAGEGAEQQTSDPNAPVLEHGQSSDPNTAFFSWSHETDVGPFTNVEDARVKCTFPISPPRSTQAPLACQPSGGVENLITLTALSSVVSTLVRKVKALEVKLNTKKRKMVVSDSDQEDGGKQDVDLDALRALANAACSYCWSYWCFNCSSCTSAIPLGASTIPAGSLSVPADVPSSVAPAGVSSKGKSPMVEEDITVKARTLKQLEEERLAEEAAKRLHDKELAQMERQRAEVQRRRQQDVLDSAMYYNKADWLNIMAQVEANASLSKTLLEFEKIYKVQSNSQIQAFSRTLKRSGPVLEDSSSKRQQSTEAPIPSVPKVSQSSAVSSPPSSVTRKKSLTRKRLPKPKSSLQKLNLDVDAQTFVKVVSNEDSDDKARPVLSALVGWEILHMVDRQDLVKLYGLVVKYYENLSVFDVGLFLWSDLQVLFDSHKGGKGSCVWQHQNLWEIKSWWLYTLSNVHSDVLSMFADVSYPFSVKLMEKMLTHKLEIDSDVVGNDMTTAEQLIQFIKNQHAAAQCVLNNFLSLFSFQVFSYKGFWVLNSPMLYLMRVEMVINSPWIIPIVGTKELASPEQTALDISFCKEESLLCLACDYISYSPSLTGSKDLSRVGSNMLRARGVGFVWERVVEVMGSSGGSGEVEISGEEGSGEMAGKSGMNNNCLNVGGEDRVSLGVLHNCSLWARGAGFVWERVVEVMGSIGGSGEK
nr:aminoacyl-tRNA synthetase, class 1a, anticodon-binding [Tanacetum cinerariifolium]